MLLVAGQLINRSKVIRFSEEIPIGREASF